MHALPLSQRRRPRGRSARQVSLPGWRPGPASPPARLVPRLLRAAALVAVLSAPGRGRAADGPANAEPPGPAETAGSPAPERLSLHYQATVATQWHPGFAARYSGPNSLRPGRESATSVVADLVLGARPWAGAELVLQPELAGGRGLSSTLGVAAFPSGEVYRVGNPAPSVIVGRLLLRQVVGLGGGTVQEDPSPSQLGGPRDRDALIVTLGKLATTDVLDANPVAGDPHTRFSSWGLWASAAFDYPADTRGYTYGVAADLSVRWWSLRAGAFLEPTTANGMVLDWDVSRSHGLAVEGEARYAVGDLPGAVRALVFRSTARMGSYRQALEDAPAAPDLAATRRAGRAKSGVAASANQELGAGLAAFLRVSWNDGREESWAFTEIDRSIAGGLVQSGARWRRPRDAAGLAVVVSGLSGPHRRYLAAGGTGFLIGDGALRFGPEVLGEVFYQLAVTRAVSAIVSYQPILDPGFNRDRGPVSVLGGRVHVDL